VEVLCDALIAEAARSGGADPTLVAELDTHLGGHLDVHRTLSSALRALNRVATMVAVCGSDSEFVAELGKSGIVGFYDPTLNYVAINLDAPNIELTAEVVAHATLHEIAHALLTDAPPQGELMHGPTFRRSLMYLDYRHGLLTQDEFESLEFAVRMQYSPGPWMPPGEYTWEINLCHKWARCPTGRFALTEKTRAIDTYASSARRRARKVLPWVMRCTIDEIEVAPATITLHLASGVDPLRSALRGPFSHLARAVHFELAPQGARDLSAELPLRGSLNILDHLISVYAALGEVPPTRMHLGPRGIRAILAVVSRALNHVAPQYTLSLGGEPRAARLTITESGAVVGAPVLLRARGAPVSAPVSRLIDALVRDEPFLVNTTSGASIFYDGYLINGARSRRETLVVRDALVDPTPRALDMLRDLAVVESESDIARGVREFLEGRHAALQRQEYCVACVRDDIFVFDDLLPLIRFDEEDMAFPESVLSAVEWEDWWGRSARSRLFVCRDADDGAGDLSEQLYHDVRQEADAIFSRPGVVRELLKPKSPRDIAQEIARRVREGAPFLYLLAPSVGNILTPSAPHSRTYVWVLSTGSALYSIEQAAGDICSGIQIEQLLRQPALTLSAARPNLRDTGRRAAEVDVLHLPAATFGAERETNLLRAPRGAAWSVFESLQVISSLNGRRAAQTDESSLVAVFDAARGAFRYVLTSGAHTQEVSSTFAWWLTEV
jgi:hypothetical protein